MRKQLDFMSKGNNRDTAISDSERVSIFSFTKRNSLISFIIFTVLVGLYGTFLIRTYPSKLEEGFFNKFTSIISYVSTFIPVAIVLVLALDLGGAIIMILIGWVKDRRKKEREEQINEAVNKAKTETLGEIQAKIDFWNSRRMQAEQDGRKFTEPLDIVSSNRQDE